MKRGSPGRSSNSQPWVRARRRAISAPSWPTRAGSGTPSGSASSAATTSTARRRKRDRDHRARQGAAGDDDRQRRVGGGKRREQLVERFRLRAVGHDDRHAGGAIPDRGRGLGPGRGLGLGLEARAPGLRHARRGLVRPLGRGRADHEQRHEVGFAGCPGRGWAHSLTVRKTPRRTTTTRDELSPAAVPGCVRASGRAAPCCPSRPSRPFRRRSAWAGGGTGWQSSGRCR